MSIEMNTTLCRKVGVTKIFINTKTRLLVEILISCIGIALYVGTYIQL